MTMVQIAEYRLYPVDKDGHVDGPPRSFHAVMMKLQSTWPDTWSTATMLNFGSLTGLLPDYLPHTTRAVSQL